MDLQKLFDIQSKLDERIVKEHGLQGQDLLDKKILALQVELGELANEWRGFKFWSKDQKPKRVSNIKSGWDDAGKYRCLNCKVDFYGEPVFVCSECENPLIPLKREYPLLEEYVDCLHFILSIGLEKGYEAPNINKFTVARMKRIDITKQFNYLFEKVGDSNGVSNHNNYMYIITLFIGLGEMLGFTEQKIYDAYMDKNKTNHNRQDTGY